MKVARTPTTFANAVSTIDGTFGDFGNVTSVTGSRFVLRNGGQANLDLVSNADGASFDVSGGVTLTLPAVAAYTHNTNGNFDDAIIRATGAGSVVSLPNLTTLSGSTRQSSDLFIEALAGGQVQLGGLTTIPVGQVHLSATIYRE